MLSLLQNSGRLGVRQDCGGWGRRCAHAPDGGQLEGRGLRREPRTFPGTPEWSRRPPRRGVGPRAESTEHPFQTPGQPSPPRLAGQQVEMTGADMRSKGPPPTEAAPGAGRNVPADAGHLFPGAFRLSGGSPAPKRVRLSEQSSRERGGWRALGGTRVR